MTATKNMIHHRIHLNNDYMDNATSTQPDFALSGKTVYLRTYSRTVTDDYGKERRENWKEIIQRVVEYSFDLHIGTDETSINNEAHELFSAMYHLRGFPAGRTLWVGGTAYVDPRNTKGTALASMNCAFTTIDEPEDFYDIVYLLMNGTGVGFSATADSVKSLNKTAPVSLIKPEVFIKPYHYTPPEDNDETIDYNYYTFTNGTMIFDIGDSREAWGMFLRDFITAYLTGSAKYTFDALLGDASGAKHKRRIVLSDNGGYSDNSINQILITGNRVRPKNTPLKTFGGEASGPDPLFDFIMDLQKLVEHEGIHQWTDTLINDVVTMMARAVVSGGKRRSALISCGDADSEEFASMKTGQWYDTHPWRSQANNSQYFYSKPTKDQLLKRLNQALVGDPDNGVYPAGEPGMFNMEEANRRRDGALGFNPCGEILLRKFGLCNLVEGNMPAHLLFDNDGHCIGYDKRELFHTMRLIARHNLRITNVDFAREMPAWDKVQKEDRLCGVALSGMVDFQNALGWTTEQMGVLLKELRDYVIKEVNEYADEMGINRPLLITTIKPSGSISLIPGVSPGAHPPIAPYFWRRIRIGKNDGVARALAFLGVPFEAEIQDIKNKGKTRGIDVTELENNPTSNEAIDFADTLVFSFPAKSRSTKAANDYTAIEQLEFYKMTMQNWTQHNTSITIYVDPGEVEGVSDWMLENWDDYVGISFLPKDGGVYQQAPYEAISKEAYEEALDRFPDLGDLEEYLTSIEASGVTFSEINESCENGNCPTR